MSHPENTFIASVHKHLPTPTELHREKMHNSYRGGTADCWYSASPYDLWVEYKFIAVPKRPDTLIDLVGGKDPAISYLQQEWLRSRFSEGRQVAVIVGCKEGGVIFVHRTWETPITAEGFRDQILDRKKVAAWIVAQTKVEP